MATARGLMGATTSCTQWQLMGRWCVAHASFSAICPSATTGPPLAHHRFSSSRTSRGHIQPGGTSCESITAGVPMAAVPSVRQPQEAGGLKAGKFPGGLELKLSDIIREASVLRREV